jgi:hypothetical protein
LLRLLLLTISDVSFKADSPDKMRNMFTACQTHRWQKITERMTFHLKTIIDLYPFQLRRWRQLDGLLVSFRESSLCMFRAQARASPQLAVSAPKYGSRFARGPSPMRARGCAPRIQSPMGGLSTYPLFIGLAPLPSNGAEREISSGSSRRSPLNLRYSPLPLFS